MSCGIGPTLRKLRINPAGGQLLPGGAAELPTLAVYRRSNRRPSPTAPAMGSWPFFFGRFFYEIVKRFGHVFGRCLYVRICEQYKNENRHSAEFEAKQKICGGC